MALDKTVALWGQSQPEPAKKVEWPGWETVKLIGRGSFGAVYEIQRDVLGDVEKAALKVLSIPQNESDLEEMYCEGHDSESITQTFRSHLQSIVSEYSLMRKMGDCHNIVRSEDIRYVQHDDGIGWDIYIKMELLTPLMKSLPDKISERTVRKLAMDICNALVVCKEYDVIHRDIKPQNIFVSSRGEYKLGDFGIAKTVEKTMGGTLIGTYKYMAPEVFFYKPYGHSADIYSLGLVLYWLLNERRMPFLPLPPAKASAGMEEQARMRRFQGEQLPPPAHGSAELKQIVMKACAYDPKDRYATAAEMLRDLQEGFADTKPASTDQSAVQREAEEARQKAEADRLVWEHIARQAKERERLRKEQEEQDKTVALFGNDRTVMLPQTEQPKPAPKAEPQKEQPKVTQTPFAPYRITEPLKTIQTQIPKKKSGDGMVGSILSGWLNRTTFGWYEENGETYYYKYGFKQTGWQEIDGKTYYFANDGIMCNNWQKIGERAYYFGSDGVMRTGWQKIGLHTHYFGDDGAMRTGWRMIDGKHYYFDNNGIKCTGWQVMYGSPYYFGDNGVMCTGWQEIDGKTYYFGLSGAMRTGKQKIDGKTTYLMKMAL